MLKIVATICLFFSLTIVVCPQSNNRTWLNGNWEGTGYQIDTNETWTMSFKAQGRRFLIEYPSLNCGGEWQLISLNARSARFREKITRGLEQCTNTGLVVIERLSRRQIAFRYSNPGSREVTASAILNRKR